MSRVLVMPRVINVGSRSRVPMAELRVVLGNTGFKDVATILQSGNIIVTRSGVDDPELVRAEVANLIDKHFGVSVPTLVRSAEDLDRIPTHNSLAGAASDDSKYLVDHFHQLKPKS